jgi:diguanylate cyclase (GGDEF)-like protein
MVAMTYIWINIKEKSIIELSHISRLNSSAMTNLLNNYQGLLKSVGERVLELDGLNNTDEARKLVDSMLADNPGLAGFGLSTPQGDLVLTSSNIVLKQPFNFLKMPETAVDFKKALESRHLIVGHTYFFEGFKKWVIPIRYALRNEQGKVMAVLSTGLDLDSNVHIWNLDLPEGVILHVVRQDRSIQYDSSIVTPEEHQMYYEPIAPEVFDRIKAKIETTYGLDFEAFKTSGLTVQTENFHNDAWFDVIGYNRQYNYLIAASKMYRTLYMAIVPYAAIILSSLLILNILLALMFRYISRLQKTTKETLSYQAHHDQLTTLPNRYYLKEYFGRWQRRHGHDYALLYLDLDNFKVINDHYGHSIGDSVLVELAKRLKECCKEETMLIRHGGDEFIMLLPYTDRQDLQHFIDHIIYRINERIRVEGLEFTISGSIGIATARNGATSLDELLRRADLAMYEAKKERNSFALFNEAMHQLSARRSEIEEALHTALERQEFYMVYQPQIHAENGYIAGVEALIRWEHPTLGFIPPDQFIPVAESSGQINAIGNFVIDTAFKKITAVQAIGQSIRLSVNVSVRQLLNQHFRSYLNERSAHYSLSPSNIVIEITESLFIEDFEQIRNLLVLLRDDGYRISLDDFGTGYSSLSVLSKLPINEVKVDKSFVRDILVDNHDRALIQSIIGIGHSLDIPTLAEGVEELEQALALKSYGCDLFQGYYFAKPMKQKELSAYLNSFKPYKF